MWSGVKNVAMKRFLFIAALGVLAVSCRKEAAPRPLPNGTQTFHLDRIDNIAFAGDNGLLISGLSGDQYTFIKTDASLATEWTKSGFDGGKIVSGSGWGSSFYSVKIVNAFQRQDGSFVCIGTISYGGDVMYSAALIIVLDKDGRQINKYRDEDMQVWDVVKTGDGYVLFGSSLMKLDNNFNTVWKKAIYNTNSYFPAAITPTSDRGFAITGTYGSDLTYLQKIGASGNELFTRTYQHNAEPFDESGFAITQLADGGFLIAGRAGQASPPSTVMINCQLIRTDSKGDTLWTKRFEYPVNSWIDQIVSNDQNEIVLKASVGFPADSIQKTALIKINSAGEVLKSKLANYYLLLEYAPPGKYVIAEPDAPNGIKVRAVDEGELFD